MVYEYSPISIVHGVIDIYIEFYLSFNSLIERYWLI